MIQIPSYADEIKEYTASGNAEEIYNIINFTDSGGIPNLQAVQDCAALQLIYGSGKNFAPFDNYLNSFALRVVYRSAGREQEGFDAAADPKLRQEAGLTAYDENAWADGFYILALKDGLITSEQFIQAYTDESSEFSKTRNVSVQNFIKWMCRIHNIPLINSSLPGEVYVDINYAAYYHGALKQGILTNEQIQKFAAWRYLTKSDMAEILQSFEGQILPKLGLEQFSGNVSQIHEDYKANKREITLTNNAESIIITTALTPDAPVFAQLENEIPVLGKNQGDTTGSIRFTDAAKVYIKNDKALFIRILSSNSDIEYLKNPVVYKGTLFLYDYTTSSIILDNVKKAGKIDENIWGYQTFYLKDNAKIYYCGNEISTENINAELSDKSCIIYVNYDYAGGMERVRSIIIE